MRPILFLVSAASSYRLLKYVAEHLTREGRSVSFLYERGHDATFELIQADAAALGAETFALDAFVDAARRSTPAWKRHPRLRDAMAIGAHAMATMPGPLQPILAKKWPTTASTSEVAQLTAFHAALASQLDAAKRILRRVRPQTLVACDDGIASSLAVHAAARHAGVPVVVVPYGYGVRRDLEISLDAKAAQGELITANGRWSGLLRSHAPQWIKTGEHEGALMYPEAYIVAAESLGLTLRDAWVIHGGDASRLCAESRQMERVYLAEGVPKSKLALTGTPYCDVMVRALDNGPAAQAALKQPRRIEPSVTRVLVSWPPSYHADRARYSEFASYREMSLAVLGWLTRLPGCAVTVSLHPATLPDDRAALLDIGVALTDQYVIGLIPQHDVLITYFSSTIRWAVASGKPVINFDLYKLRMDVYDAAPGVLKVETFADFQREVIRLAGSEAAFAETAGRQIAVADDWGILDGQSTARVAAEIQAARA